jgi:hypothetical protein
MNPNSQTQQNNFSLNRNQSQPNQPTAQQPAPGQQAPAIPFMTFPANQPRDYDQGIKEMIFNLVERKYRPNAFIVRYQQMSAQNPQLYPALDDITLNMLKAQGPDISEAQRDFEVARVYNKLEMDIFMMSNSQLSPEKQEELKKMTDEAQANPQADQGDLIIKIRDFMQQNVPNIQEIVQQYMLGFTNEYLAGHY